MTGQKLAHALQNLADVLTRESLKHPKHAVPLDPIRADAKAVLARFFKRQRALLLATIAPALRTVAKGNVKTVEAAGAEARDAIRAALPDDTLLPLAVTQGMAVDYDKAMTAALAAGYETLAGEFSAEGSISGEVTAAYLRERSLEALTTQLSGTTVSRLQTALADAYEGGADYDGLVEAVKEEYADMADKRAGTIAQTGMNSAYNAGRLQLGKDLDFNEKSWSCDGPDPCGICLANEAAGWLPLDDAFPDGSDVPVAHPGCYCSLDVRLKAQAKAA